MQIGNEKYQVLSGYRFRRIEDPGAWVGDLKALGLGLGLKGTILVSTEGININVAGSMAALNNFQKALEQRPGLGGIDYKLTDCTQLPFDRFVVRHKPEIINMGQEGVDAQADFGPYLKPEDLKTWLDQGREFTLLDTRNDYEVNYGRFNNAIYLGVKTFQEFAQKSKCLPEAIKQKPLVMYCTGGIRCEKASAFFLKNLGFREVYQLEGGILNYLQKCGHSHFDGSCFVFDKRWEVS